MDIFFCEEPFGVKSTGEMWILLNSGYALEVDK